MALLICSHIPHGKLQRAARCCKSFHVCLWALQHGQVAQAPAEHLDAPRRGPRSGGRAITSQMKTLPHDPAVQVQHMAPETLLPCPACVWSRVC